MSIDAFFRPAAITLALLCAALLLRDARADRRALLGALFGAGTAAYMLCSIGAGATAAGWLIVPLCIGNAVFFWWFALALLDDEFRLGAIHFGVLAAFLALGLARLTARRAGFGDAGLALAVVHNMIVLAMIAHVLVRAWRDYDDDLLEARRRFRLLFLIGGSLAAIGIAVAEVTLAGAPAPAWLLSLQSVSLSILAAMAAAWLLSTSPARLAFQGARAAKEPAPFSERQQLMDEGLSRSLEHAMAVDKAYLEQGLTIAALAKRLGVPEHRLRAHINETLGWRNFNAYVNRHRVAAAKAALSDPKLAHLPVLTIALDSGFASLPPFNRAFRAEAGQSPSAWREARLAEARKANAPIESKKA